jgi:hypothetical protein
MKTKALPEYNIAHHTPNANRRACHRDPRDDDAHNKDDADSSRQSSLQELCVGTLYRGKIAPRGIHP